MRISKIDFICSSAPVSRYCIARSIVSTRDLSLPIYACYAAKKSFESCGEGIVLIVRQHTGGNFTVGVYLVDTWCRGIRDTFYRVRIEKEELDELIENFETQGIEPVEYEEAHNWVYGALDWAEQAGIHPHKGFDTTKFLLADDEDESVPIVEYEFGQDGKHCFVANSEAGLNRKRRDLIEFSLRSCFEMVHEFYYSGFFLDFGLLNEGA